MGKLSVCRKCVTLKARFGRFGESGLQAHPLLILSATKTQSSQARIKTRTHREKQKRDVFGSLGFCSAFFDRSGAQRNLGLDRVSLWHHTEFYGARAVVPGGQVVVFARIGANNSWSTT